MIFKIICMKGFSNDYLQKKETGTCQVKLEGLWKHTIMRIDSGSGGGTSGRATAICLGRRSSNAGIDLSFFHFRIAVNLFLLGIRVFQMMCFKTVHIFPSFLFPVCIFIYHFKI